jgi:tetratricopeptide (TPR) repeat protein
MPSIVPGYEYDIFISYRQKDNKYDGWVSDFVNNLRKELEATFKEDLSIYTDENPQDGLLETHNVDKSLEGKLKSLIFIPIISQTYCDTKSFAWTHEFCAFNKMAQKDSFSREIKLGNGNVASRILPVRIHDLDAEDKALLESELKGPPRAIEFIYKSQGVNRPLKPDDSRSENLNHTYYRDQINKVANAVKEIITSIKRLKPENSIISETQISQPKSTRVRFQRIRISTKILIALISLIIVTTGVLSLNKFHFWEKSLRTKHNNIITTNPVAYEWYKKAEFRFSADSNDVNSCIAFLKKAIEADPSFALAHVKLSLYYSIKNFYFSPNGGNSENAFLEAEKAIYLNPGLAEGYIARAQCIWTFQNKFPHEKAIHEYKKAISLDPDLDEAYRSLAMVYWHVGLMQESFEAVNKALQINPENKYASLNLTAWYFFTANKTDLEHGIELYTQTPDNLLSPITDSYWAIALIELDRSPEAEKLLSDRMKKDSSNIFYNSALAILLAKKGERKGALQRIQWCESKNLKTGHFHHAVYNLAIAEALLGNNQESVDKLTWVAENGFPCYTYFRDDPLLISLHEFAPYNDLLKKLKVSWEKYRQIAKE